MAGPAHERSGLPVSEPIVARTSRLESLTGLRILAALAVYLSHVETYRHAPKVVKTFQASGYMGVTLFFVLSGFVLSLNYFEKLRRPSGRAIWAYVVARFARIYPLYLVVLVYVIVRTHSDHGAPVTDWLLHVFALQAWSSDVSVAFGLNGPGWSVSVEIFLYACFPLLVLALGRLRTLRALLLTAAGVALGLLALTAWFAASGRGHLPPPDPGSAHRWLYRTPLTRLFDFTLGILAARIYLQTRGRPGVVRAGSPMVVVGGVLILGLMAWPVHHGSAWSWDLSYAIPGVLVIFGLAVAPLGRLAKGLSLPAIVLLGEASYAFYLVHQPLLIPLGAGRWATGLTVSSVAFEVLTLGLVLAVAVGLHVLVEKPARIWIRRRARVGA